MQWAYHHLFRSYELRPYKRPICSRDTLYDCKVTKDYLDYMQGGEIIDAIARISSIIDSEGRRWRFAASASQNDFIKITKNVLCNLMNEY